MVFSSESVGGSTLSNNKSAVVALENSLHQSIHHLKELVIDFNQLQLGSEESKTQILMLKAKCESKVCVGSEALKKVIELKDNIIQSVASALTRLNETKDMSIIDEAFKILCGETVSLTPPKDSSDFQLKTPKKEMSPSFTEVLNDESVSEIEGTPTGRTSPIIVSRKARIAAASDHREKKKCPDNWSTPKTKTLKLTYPNFCTPNNKTGKGKLRQTRFTTVKQTSALDVSSSEFALLNGTKDTKSMQLNIKRESLDDEDTIEPSPTSITTNFSSMYRSAVRSSPLKLSMNSPNKVKASPGKLSLVKKPHSSISKLQIKTEGSINAENVENKYEYSDGKMKMEESINLLRPPRFRTPEKHPNLKDPDETECNIDSSMSLLQHVKKLEKISPDHKNICSPTKRPLAENFNFTNLQTQCDTEASLSLLNNNHFIDHNIKNLERTPHNTSEVSKKEDTKTNPALEAIVRKDLERLEPKRQSEIVDVMFKEPTVRKKAEKRALPGWSCDECKNFYAELYKNDPEMLAKKMDECSKHRGRQNPARPKTPPGFWYPRWDVPEDTEEFNRRNNAV